jgi:hypothetical protein
MAHRFGEIRVLHEQLYTLEQLSFASRAQPAPQFVPRRNTFCEKREGLGIGNADLLRNCVSCHVGRKNRAFSPAPSDPKVIKFVVPVSKFELILS